MVKRKHKVTREEIAWWIYLVIMVALVIYGFRDSAAAEVLIRAIKIIVVVLSFSLTLYIQHVNNTAQIAELETKCIGLEVEIKNQYDRINAMKLDKSVFEATMMQLNTVQNDLHEIRADIRELLKCQNLHK